MKSALTNQVPEMDVSSYIKKRRDLKLLRRLRGVIPLSARECMVEGCEGACLDFSSNDYLGMSWRSELVEESVGWTRRYGTGSRASRLVSGTLPEYLRLEEQIAEWKGFGAAMILGSGFLANTGIIPALAGRKSAVFADKLNHASLNAGCMLSGAEFIRYGHNDMAMLSARLKECPSKEKLVVSDTVFSMDGDVAEPGGLRAAARPFGARIYLDDAHATGVLGPRGRGMASAEFADIAMGTFSKALGSYGAYAACSREMKEYLVNACGPFIYSTALPPGVCGAISAAVSLVQTEEFDEVRSELKGKTARLVAELKRLGFDTGKTSTPIIPVLLGSPELALRTSQFLLDKRVMAIPIRPPTVPEGMSRIRISVNACHTQDDLCRLLGALEDSRRELGGPITGGELE